MKRMWFMMIIIAAVFAVLMIRLFYIQVIEGPELEEKALSQWTSDTTLSADRGEIRDRDGTVLAQSGTTYKILVWPQVIKQTEQLNRERIATELSELLGMDKGYVLERITSDKQEIVLKRQVERETVEQLATLKLGNGVGTTVDTKRYYPEGSLFSQLVGFTTVDGDGQEGLERTYNTELAGQDGRSITETDRKGNALAYGTSESIDPVDGYTLVLTADSVEQTYLTRALEQAREDTGCTTAQGVVMNASTGEILAIASEPDYDPNSPPRDDLTLLREVVKNRVVTDSSEPGTAFSLITLAAALDSGAIDETTVLECTGSLSAEGETFSCTKSRGHGSETVSEAVINGCENAYSKLSLLTGRETFYDYLYAFGFGSKTDCGITGETAGTVTHEKYIGDAALMKIAIGQEIEITPIQLAAAACTAVNGGNLMKPYVIAKMLSASGETISETEPTVVRRVLKESTSEALLTLLEASVSSAGAKNGSLSGYRAASLSGTAERLDESGNKTGTLTAYYVGTAPADDPKYVVVLFFDGLPYGRTFSEGLATYYGKQVLESTLHHYGILPSSDDDGELVTVPNVAGEGLTASQARYELEKSGLSAVGETDTAVTKQLPAAGETVKKGTGVLLFTEGQTEQSALAATETEEVTVPNLIGLSRIEAHDKLAESGLVLEIDPPDQSGTVVYQKPAAGTKVTKGSSVRADFSDVSIGE